MRLVDDLLYLFGRVFFVLFNDFAGGGIGGCLHDFSLLRGLSASLAGAVDDVFVGGELLCAYRAAGVETASGNADFSAEAEFAAVGELCGGVVHYDGGIDAAKEVFSGGDVGSDNGVGVVAAMAVYVGNGFIGICHKLYRDDGGEVFGVPIAIGGRMDAIIEFAGGFVATDFASGGVESIDQRGQEILGD